MDYAKESLKKHAEWGGKIEVICTVPCKTKDDLSLAYTPGVAQLYEDYGNTPQDKTVDDQWESQVLCRVLMKHKVIFVSTPDKKDIITDMKMDYAESLEEALAMAKAIKGEDASITVIPNGISVIVKE